MQRSGMMAASEVRSALITVNGGDADCVRMVPYLRAARQRFPEAEIAVLTPAQGGEFLASCPYVDHVIPMRYRDTRRRTHLQSILALASILRRWRGRFDLFVGSPFHWRFNAALGLLIGARQSTGFTVGPMPTPWTIDVGPVDYSRSLEANLDRLWDALGVEQVDPRLESWPSPEDNAYIDRLLECQDVRPGEILVALHPGSDWGCQQWTPGHWAELGRELQWRYNARLVVTGSADEIAEYQNIAMRMRSAPIDMTGKTSQRQLAALLRRVHALVSVDSVAVPLGIAAQAPVVTLGFRNPSPWSESRWPNLTPLYPPPSLSGLAINQACRIRKQRRGVHWCKPPVCIGAEAARARANLIKVWDVLESLDRIMAGTANLSRPG